MDLALSKTVLYMTIQNPVVRPGKRCFSAFFATFGMPKILLMFLHEHLLSF